MSCQSNNFRPFTLAIAMLAIWVAGTGGLMAAPLIAPTGEVVLTVSGEISNVNTDTGQAVFDLEQLRALPTVRFSTSTIWTEGDHDFAGVPLRVLLETVGGDGALLKVSAINDYTVEIPTSDLGEDYPIIAYEMDGGEMSVRNKGPLWVVFPYDLSPNYRTEVIYSQSIWQLVSINVTE